MWVSYMQSFPALRIKAVIILFFGVVLLLPGLAQAKYASLIMDADTGRVLHSVNADTRNYPASLTKMMTLYMIFDALERGKITMNTKWKASKRAVRQPASKLGMKRGEIITVRNAIYALITKSANDVATLVSENLAKSERDFALAMTAKARKIGMSRTTFRNASGLPNKGQLSTAHDMGVLAQALIQDFPEKYSLFSMAKFEYRGSTYKNHNKLLKAYEGTDGIKTGYIRASGFNLVASVVRNGTRLIGVVFGGDTSRKRNAHMMSLLDKGFGIIAAENAPAQSQNTITTASLNLDASKQITASKYSWGIQVGAYTKESQASEVAYAVSAIVPKLLNTGFVTVVPLVKNSGKIIYRSRIHRIPKKQAYKACRILKNRGTDCMVVKLPVSQQVAAAN
ncbi:MAG: D-alanyl-D-alanine carboxypeptidase [Rhodospirillales bacterium]|jgi:D-alanyl-D-alanine carboxypeptidase|nr:D-alanyl-D-alanine carboxypeptidase [Rhodospirillales bacterium]